MRNNIFIAVLVLASCMFPFPGAQAGQEKPKAPYGELGFRGNLRNKVTFYRTNGFVDRLEKMAENFRRTRARTPSGVWQLTVFYDGTVSDMPPEDEGRDRAATLRLWTSRIEEWLEQHPKSPTIHIFHANDLINWAWRIRGTGYARSVWPEDMKRFLEKMDQAAEVLDSSRDFASVDPHWYVLRLRVAKARGEGVAAILALLQEASEKEPYYYQSYTEALRGLRPEWGGHWALVDKVIEWSVERTRERDGTSMLARAHWALGGNKYTTGKFAADTESWSALKVSIADLLDRYPILHNVNYFLPLACRARNAEAARWIQSQRKRIGGVALRFQPDDPKEICNWKDSE